MVTLAFWRVRETWRLLLVATLGVMVAVVLVCAVPLFSRVSLTAGLRAVLNATPQDSEAILSTQAISLNQQVFAEEIDQPLRSFMQEHLGTAIKKRPEFILQTQGIDIISSDPGESGNQMALLGFDMQQAAAHAELLQGRLPEQRGAELEGVITQKTADALRVSVGATIPLSFSFYLRQVSHLQVATQTLQLRVVGIFAPERDDPFWQGYDFDPSPLGTFISYKALMSTDTYLALLTTIGHAHEDDGVVYFVPNQQPFLDWYYTLDVNRISMGTLDDLIARLFSAQTQIVHDYGQTPYFSDPQLFGPPLELYGAPSTLERYRDRAAVASIPADILLIQVLALTLFFASMIADLIIDRQAGVIALLRSRGASRHHIFGSFVTQSIGLGLIALAVGPLLAIPLARILGLRLLAPADQNALNVIDGSPLQIALTLRWFALAAAACAVIAMILSVRGSTSQDVLALRREAARSTRHPLWRRLNLDVFFVIIALTGFGLSLYVTHTGALDARTNLLISTPLALVAPMLLIVAGILLFLRLFPLLLQLGAWLSARRPGAPMLLAIAQMARAPRQATRMILLLALASGFGVFTLVFQATQAQQARKVSAYQVGADFSGTIPPGIFEQPPLAQQTAAYRRIPGVLSAALGYSTQAVPEGNNQSIALEIRAVDTSTYARTAIWTDQDASQPLPALMQELARQSASGGSQIPAIVDALAWNALDLSKGATFSLALSNSGAFLPFIAIEEVQHIPTVNDSLVSGGTGDYSPPGGILIDYQTFATIFGRATDSPIQRNEVWLRTSDEPAMLASVRRALSSGPLALVPFYDRRAMIARSQSDPLYVNLIGDLALGAAIALLLALVGNLISSWLSARNRLMNFALLRALGSTPGQVARVLLCEQSVVYSIAIGLGVIFGALLAVTAIPALVFTSATQALGITSGEFYVIQRVLPVQMVIPPSLIIALALLVLLCITALGMMARIVSKPSISQTLRLNED
jgi:ABC-type lipoprotein release transport system permease subunit